MSKQLCPECGKTLPAASRDGTCPTCLLTLGLSAALSESPASVSLGAPAPGDQIGRYKLLELIGEGGFGHVWMAEQQEPVRRRVALKILKLGMDTREVVARFEAERQALAMMDHANIARVFDGGATESGRPYFVMELVKGVPITEYCDTHRLDTEQRLKLFMDVCEAVQHAHQKGIIHRDLKPSNVLVTEQDGRALPKVIDFGIAKATELELTERTFFTRFNQVIGTPVYMSPEQAGLGSLDIDTRSDIYALGVILYELLTGRTPFPKEELANVAFDEVLRTIRKKDPKNPSTYLSTLSQKDLLAVAHRRASQPARLNRQVRGELDWIVMKCLEKDRARRYETANGLARDVERHLQNEPVVARPPTAFYRLQKMIRRQRLVFATATVMSASLAVGGIMLVHAYRRTQAALHDSLLAQAKAQLAARQVGQRFEVLAALEQAATIKNSLELRSEAAAALARPDARLLARWPDRVRSRSFRCAFSPDLETYIVSRTSGGCELRATKDQSLLRFFPETPKGRTKANRQLELVVFSRDGRRFAVQYGDRRLDVWDRNSNEPLLGLQPSDKAAAAFDFAPGGNLVVFQTLTQGLCVHSLADGSRRALLPPETGVQFVRFDPNGERLAIVQTNALQVWNFAEAKPLWTVPAEAYVDWAAWSPDGQLVAAADQRSRDIMVFDAKTGTLLTRFAGHTSTPHIFEFHPVGQWVASTARDSTVEIWDRRSGSLVIQALTGSFHALQFSSDGRRLATGAGTDQIGISELHQSTVFREFQTTGQGNADASWMDASGDGRFLVTATFGDCRLWDTESKRELHVLPTEARNRGLPRVFFGPEDDEIIYSRGGEGTFRYALNKSKGESGKATIIGVGTRQPTPVPQGANLVSVGQNRQSWLIRGHQNNPEIWSAGNREHAKVMPPDRGYLSISPDARWIATTPQPPTVMEVWDTASHRKVFTSKSHRIWATCFSPDGKWLVGTGADGHVVFETGTWKQAFHFQYEGGGNATFAQGGRLMALVRGTGEVQLYAMPRARCLINLKPPQPLLGTLIMLREDGNRLWLLVQGNRVYEWDLSKLRRELAQRGLDWQE